MNETKGKARWSVMSVTIVLFALMLVAFVVNAEAFYDILNKLVMNNLMWGLGWFTSIVCLIMVVLCVVVMITPIGKIKLGGPNAKPKFTYLQWFGISLCTGIGAGVVFWGAAEPLLLAAVHKLTGQGDGAAPPELDLHNAEGPLLVLCH